MAAALNDIRRAIQATQQKANSTASPNDLSSQLQQQQGTRILPQTAITSKQSQPELETPLAASPGSDPWMLRRSPGLKPDKNLVGGVDSGVLQEQEVDEEEETDDDDDEDEDDSEEDDDEDEDEEEDDSEVVEERVPTPKNNGDEELDTDQETDRLLGQQYNDDNGYFDSKVGMNIILLISTF